MARDHRVEPDPGDEAAEPPAQIAAVLPRELHDLETLVEQHMPPAREMRLEPVGRAVLQKGSERFGLRIQRLEIGVVDEMPLDEVRGKEVCGRVELGRHRPAREPVDAEIGAVILGQTDAVEHHQQPRAKLILAQTDKQAAARIGSIVGRIRHKTTFSRCGKLYTLKGNSRKRSRCRAVAKE